MRSARVTRESGASFSARVDRLATTSLLLVTSEQLGYRERILVELLGVRTVGEVVFVSPNPPGFGVMLEPAPEVVGAIQAELDRESQEASQQSDDRRAAMLAEWRDYWHRLTPDQQGAYWAQLDDTQRQELTAALTPSARPAPAPAQRAAEPRAAQTNPEMARWWAQAAIDQRAGWWNQLTQEQQASWWSQLSAEDQASLSAYLSQAAAPPQPDPQPQQAPAQPAFPRPSPEQVAWWTALPAEHQVAWWMQLTHEQRASWWPVLTPEQQAWWWNQLSPDQQAWWQTYVIQPSWNQPTQPQAPQPQAPQPQAPVAPPAAAPAAQTHPGFQQAPAQFIPSAQTHPGAPAPAFAHTQAQAQTQTQAQAQAQTHAQLQAQTQAFAQTSPAHPQFAPAAQTHPAVAQTHPIIQSSPDPAPRPAHLIQPIQPIPPGPTPEPAVIPVAAARGYPPEPTSSEVESDQYAGVVPKVIESEVELENELEALAACLWVLAGRPLLVGGRVVPDHKVTVIYGETRIPFDPTLLMPNGLVALEPREEEPVRELARSLARVLDDTLAQAPQPAPQVSESPVFSAPPPPVSPVPFDEPEPPPGDVPELVGTVVRFRSVAQLRVQYRANLKQSALVVKSAPIPAGTSKTLELEIPGAEVVTLYCTAAFQGAGTVGFVVSDLDKKKSALEDIIAGVAPKKPATKLAPAVRASVPPSKGPSGDAWRGAFVGMGDNKALFEFSSRPAQSLDDAKKSFLAQLDYLLRATDSRVIARFRLKDRALAVWIAEGRIHQAKWEPNQEDDSLGRRLMRDKKISSSTLRDALTRAAQTKQPLGTALVSMGKITKATLHSTVREQYFDRLNAMFEESGTLDVGPYSEPETASGIQISYPAPPLIANLMRERVRRIIGPDLEALLASYNEREIAVVADRLDPNLSLPKKEMRFFERVQSRPMRLMDAPTITATAPTDTHRAALVGIALGILELRGKLALAAKDRSAEVLKDYALRYEQARKASPFEALGLHWSASEASIASTHQKLVDEIKATERMVNGEAKELSSKYLDVVNKAHAAIATRGGRKEVRDKLVNKSERRSAADHLVNQAEMLLIRGSAKDARLALETAEELASTPKAAFLLDRIKKGGTAEEASIEEQD